MAAGYGTAWRRNEPRSATDWNGWCLDHGGDAGEWTGWFGSSQIDSRRRPLEMNMSKRKSGSMSLWSIVEALQRRLERQGLAKDVIDAAVVSALAQAMNGAARA